MFKKLIAILLIAALFITSCFSAAGSPAINTADVITMLRVLVGADTETDTTYMDRNGDGSFSLADAIEALRVVAGDYRIWQQDESGTTIRLMTQNIRYANSLTGTGDGTNNTLALRQYRFKALVEKYDPDVICMQEVTPLWIEQLQTLLGDTYSIEYKMRSEKSKEATPVLYKTAKYELLQVKHFWLSETPDVESSCYGEIGIPARISTAVWLKDKATGAEFCAVSTHFGLGGGQVVQGAGNQLADMLAAMPEGSNAFVLGDFNDSYQSTTYKTYCDADRMIDLRDVTAEMAGCSIGSMGTLKNGTFSGFNVNKSEGNGSYIDHVMAKPNANMALEYYSVLYDQLGDTANNVTEGYVSDHFAVLCDVRIETTPSYVDFYPSYK